ncbi:MFS_1_like domain-containing protein [Trichonephila clavata]|uniref:MFS_1_like domain-containing protein n=1 Tax=Trichonephila clavata TaxID=2740835 RepID=A0A8X6LT89_TRICU|nr:MFS_1_like domain-containing protein [Trichonephila clavata]
MTAKFKINVNKHLLTLKISLYFWLSGASALMTYLTLLLKQRGLSLEEISLIYLAANIFQFFSNTTCGIIADKIKKPKSLLILTILLSATAALCLTYSPSMSEAADKSQIFGELYYEGLEPLKFEVNRTCEILYSVKFSKNFCNEVRDSQSCEQSLMNLVLQSEKSGFTSLNVSNSLSNLEWFLNDSKVIIMTTNNYSLCDIYWNLTCEKLCTGHEFTSDRMIHVLLYTIIIILFLGFHEAVFRFLDILVMSLVKLHKADYGRQKAWPSIGNLTGPSLSTVFVIDVSVEAPAKKMWKSSIKLLKNTDFLFFTLITFVLGATWGFRVSFKNVYLENLGTPAYIIGLIETFSNLYGLPVLFTSKWLIDRMGNTKVFVLALLGYGFLCFGYSFLQEEWPAFLLELIPALSFQLFWVSAMNFCVEVSPDDLKGTVISFAGSIHFSAGRAFGNIVGGLLMSAYGGRIAFQVIAVANIVTSLAYVIYLFSKYVQKKKEQESA